MKTAESRRMMSAVLIALRFMGGIAGAASASCPRHTGDSTAKKPHPPAPSAADRVDDEIESLPKRFLRVPFFVVFLGASYLLSMATGMRMVFFPPLIVIAFEMLAHADVCPWAQRPALLPVVCTLAAAAGVAALATFGPGVTSTILAMLFGVVMLRATRLHAIPALAIALLPQVMSGVDWHFPARGRHGQHALDSEFPALQEIVGGRTPGRNRVVLRAGHECEVFTRGGFDGRRAGY